MVIIYSYLMSHDWYSSADKQLSMLIKIKAACTVRTDYSYKSFVQVICQVIRHAASGSCYACMNVLNNRSQRCWINCRFNIFYAVLFE